MHTVNAHADAASFLAATQEFRAAHPVLTNVIGSVAGSVVAGRAFDAELWLSVHAEDGSMVGCATRTAPYHLTLSPMPLPAAEVIGRHVAAVDPTVPGINGPRELVAAALRGLGAPSARVTMVETVRVLGRFDEPPPVPGTARRAAERDLPLLADWYERFGQDAGLPIPDATAALRSRLDQGALWLWTVDGEPVAMAGHATPVPTPAGDVTRIGPVYTPAPLRGHGYGSAITAAVTRHVRPSSAVVMLFADAARPENNRLYQRLGFDAVAEMVEVSIGEEQHP